MQVYSHIKTSKGLFKQKLPEIRNDSWYRQRFDACPHFMFFLGDAHCSEIQHTKYPFGQRICYAGFSKNRADWYHSRTELEHTTSKIIEAASKNPALSDEIMQEFKQWEERFYRDCLTLRQVELTGLDDAALLELYRNLANVYTNKLNASPLIDGFALSTDTLIAAKIRTFLEGIGKGDRFTEYFAILTAPTFLSFLQLEEIDLLKKVIEVQKDGSLKEQKVKAHQEEWFWIQSNYVKDNVLDNLSFEKRFDEYLGVDCDAKINALELQPEANKKKKEELMADVDLPHEIKTLLHITDDFNYWQDERKKGTFWATHYFSILLEEFSRRTGYTMKELKYCFPTEMDLVLQKKIDVEELRKRFEYCMILFVVDHYDYTTETELVEELEAIGVGKVTAAKELKGFSAELGKVRGKVTVIESVEEIGKVREGDILVAVMTRPDYLPAMKKAAAFVTDEGGITCHAAIVAREMKKPCVVGTKAATKLLKDGDVVEVDADNGVVRIVERVGE